MKLIFFPQWIMFVVLNTLVTASPRPDKDIGKILHDIRTLMNNTEIVGYAIQAYIIPMYDAHQSEYISEPDKRLQFVTGFTGSAGTAILTHHKAALWTDSRYYLQAESQLDPKYWTLMRNGKEKTPTFVEWLVNNLPPQSRVGVDSFLLPASVYQDIAADLNKSGHALMNIRENLVDIIWGDRPSLSSNKMYPIEIRFSGKPVSEKVEDLREKLRERNAEATVITALDEVAWLLNLRGSDITYNPVFFSYIILTQEKLYFYVNRNKLTPQVLKHLSQEGADCIIRNYDEILIGIRNVLNKIEGKILISKEASQAVYDSIPESRRMRASSVVARMKTIKNEVEAQGLRDAHTRDGVAVIRYLHWLDTTLGKEKITEITGTRKLEQLRGEQELSKGPSFETVSAFGSNSAIVHYAPEETTDREITRDEIYLIDSGGQYWDGTTDVTRTVHFGEPTAREKECFTRVLQGFIAVATSIFPVNTPLNYFDFIARRPLWQVGLNYGHGTGHGVGAFLNVHEYPPLISQHSGSDPGALENMFTSNEPGYYQEGQFGVRIEDVLQVINAPLEDAFEGKGALTFRTITLVPIQRKMIETKLLTLEEEKYVNEYHKTVRDVIGPILLSGNLTDTYEWLVNQTQTIKSTKYF